MVTLSVPSEHHAIKRAKSSIPNEGLDVVGELVHEV